MSVCPQSNPTAVVYTAKLGASGLKIALGELNASMTHTSVSCDLQVEDKDAVSKFADFSPEASSAAEPSTSEAEEEESPEPSASQEKPKPPPKTYKPFTGRIWPTARKILTEFGVDPWEVKGSGLNGIITKDDAVATTKGMSKPEESPETSAADEEQEEQEQVKEIPKKEEGKKETAKKEVGGAKPAAAGGPPKKSAELMAGGEFEDVPNSQIRKVGRLCWCKLMKAVFLFKVQNSQLWRLAWGEL